MLNKKEKYIFKAIYDSSAGKNTCLVSPTDILKRIPYNININKREFEDIVKTLEYDGYLELITSDNKGEKVYCITLTTKGLGFNRELVHYKRMIYFKIILTLSMALLSFIVTMVLRSIL